MDLAFLNLGRSEACVDLFAFIFFFNLCSQEENQALKLANEELSKELRRTELLHAGMHDELVRYKSAEPRSTAPSFDEERLNLRHLLQVYIMNKDICLCIGYIGILYGRSDLRPFCKQVGDLMFVGNLSRNHGRFVLR